MCTGRCPTNDKFAGICTGPLSAINLIDLYLILQVLKTDIQTSCATPELISVCRSTSKNDTQNYRYIFGTSQVLRNN